MALGTMSVDDGELAYEIRGEGSPVVLLHGGFLTGETWDAQVALLERSHTVVRYDARGHGRSSTPTKPFSRHEDLRQLLAGLDLPRASLVGLSQGARTSIDFAIAHPDLVDRLVLVGPGISGMEFRDPFILGLLGQLGSAGGVAEVVELFLRMWVDGPHRAPEAVDPEVRELCRRLMADNALEHGTASQRFVTELGAIDRVAELRAPTLLLVGDLDSSDIHGVVDLVAAEAPETRKVVVPGAAHLVNLDRPEDFDREVSAFLS